MSNELAIKQQKPRSVSTDNSTFSALMDTSKFEQLQRAASVFAKSDMVPAHYKGKIENCIIALATAKRMEVDPFMFMQNSYIVHGRPGIEAKLAIGLLNTRGIFRGGIKYETGGEGDERWCRCWAIDRETGERVEGSKVSIKTAKAEGWYDKNGSKWKTMPELMLQYRAAMFFARLHAPEVLMGLYSVEELHDMANVGQIRDVTPQSVVDTDDLNSALGFTAQAPANMEKPAEVTDITPPPAKSELKLSEGEFIDDETGEIIKQDPKPVNDLSKPKSSTLGQDTSSDEQPGWMND